MFVSPKCAAVAVVELCCSPNSMIRKACEKSGIPYCGVAENVELRGTQTSVAQIMSRQKGERFWFPHMCRPRAARVLHLSVFLRHCHGLRFAVGNHPDSCSMLFQIFSKT